jgi:hypothetical protein
MTEWNLTMESGIKGFVDKKNVILDFVFSCIEVRVRHKRDV